MNAPTRRALLGSGAMLGAGLAIGGSAAVAQRGPRPRIERRPDGLQVFIGDEVVSVRLPLAGVASVVRCRPERLALGGGFFAMPNGPTPTVRHEETATGVRAIGEGIVVEVGKRDGRILFLDGAGRLRIADDGAAPALAGFAASRRRRFVAAGAGALRGLGQFREPHFDYRDRDVFLAQANSDAVNPFLVSTDGWGLLWDTGTAAYFRSRGDTLDYHSVAGDLVRYHVCVGGDLDALVGRYRALTGAAALLPKWAYGYWQSKERYATQAELLAVVAEYRRRKLPLDGVVLDWKYWGEAPQFSAMTFDPATFPNPRVMVKAIHDQDVHMLTSIWPAFGPETAIYKEMAAGGFLFPGAHWSGGRVFDASAPAARDIYYRHVKRGLIDIGVDGLWTDGNEPEFRSSGERYITMASFAENKTSAAGPIDENLLTFSYYQGRLLAERMARDVPAKRPVLLSRSAYAGQQAFGAVTWSGDLFASWGTLANQVVAAQNFSVAGTPWWTCDIGGFFVEHRYPQGLSDPAYLELYVRWFQFGAFLPVFRAHGTQVPRELWRFGKPGEPVFDALEAALRLRYALTPYVYSTAARVAFEGDTMVRQLAMDFPDDPRAHGETASFLFGRDLLVRVVDRPLEHGGRLIQELIPNHAVQGLDAPAARVEYFAGTNFETRVADRRTDDLRISWPGDLPAVLGGKPYSARWLGRLQAQESGRHRLVVTARGTVRMMFDGRMIVDGGSTARAADPASGAVSFKTHDGDARFEVDVDLVAGRLYPFRIELRQPVADAVSLWVEWVTPSHARKMTVGGARTVSTYLPAGTDWYDFATGERHRGGQRIDAAAPLSRTPVFARAGAIVPMTPGIDRTAAQPGTLELRVHAGRDGVMTLYDDTGDGVTSPAARVALRWDDAAQRLEVGARVGAYPGMPKALAITVRLFTGGGASEERRVRYTGDAVSVRFA